MSTTSVAVAGATGFVGRALVPGLVDAGYRVRRLARRPERLDPVEGVDDTQFDLDDDEPGAGALADVDTAFYLVHAMGRGGGFAERDRAYARRFARAARAAGVRHVVYLGGLHPRDAALSEHLESRREVGTILRRECGALHVRAGIIIGAESASFEMMCDLTRRLPVMVTPRWVDNRCQAVDIGDAVAALVRSVGVAGDREVDLVGPDILTYRQMLVCIASIMGLRPRLIVGVPVLTPGLSARWLRFVTSVPLPIAHALVQSLRHDAVSDGHDLFSEVGLRPCDFDESVRRALRGRPAILRVSWEQSWARHRHSDLMRYELSTAGGCDASLLRRVDAALHTLTGRAGLGVLRWRGGELRLLRWTLLDLGAAEVAQGPSATLRRSIRGGLMTSSPGGEISFSCANHSGVHVIEARVDGYSPRLPRPLYRWTQERLHRALVTGAVRRAIARRGGDASSSHDAGVDGRPPRLRDLPRPDRGVSGPSPPERP